jgi:hypothetical protein
MQLFTIASFTDVEEKAHYATYVGMMYEIGLKPVGPMEWRNNASKPATD